MTPARTRAILIAILLALHCWIAGSIIFQPLGADGHPRVAPFLRGRFFDAMNRNGPGADFFALYHAARNLRAGLDPYSVDGDPITPYFYPFRYLAGAALCGIPFSFLPPRAGYIIWSLILEALFFSLGWLLYRRMRGIPTLSRWSLPSLALYALSSPYFLELHMGQFTFASMGCLIAGLLAVSGDSSRSSSRAGHFLFGLGYFASVSLKLYTFITLPAFARRRHLLFTACIAMLLVLLVNFPLYLAHPPWLIRFNELNFGDVWAAGGRHGGNYGFVYMLDLLIRDFRGAPLPDAQWLAFERCWRLLIWGATVLIVLLSREQAILIRSSALLFAHLITYHHVWEHHYSAVVPLGIVLWIGMHQSQQEQGCKSGHEHEFSLLKTCFFTLLLILALPTWYALLPNADVFMIGDPTDNLSYLARAALAACKALPAFVLYLISMFRLIARHEHATTDP